jgi:transcriptional regulator with XRE-family HTH domain
MDTGTPVTDGFGERLRALRSAAGLSQEALAHAAGVSVRALSDLERGRSRGPQRRTVESLAAALGLDAAGAGELERAAGAGRPRPRPAQAAAAGAGATGTDGGPAPFHTLALPRGPRGTGGAGSATTGPAVLPHARVGRFAKVSPGH